MDIPVLDDRIVFVNVTTLRTLNAKALRELKNMLVIQVDSSTRFPGREAKQEGGPLAVVMPYEMYKELQDLLWPMSVLPSWQTSPVLALAEEEDARAVDLSSMEPMQAAATASMDKLHETPSDFARVILDVEVQPGTIHAEKEGNVRMSPSDYSPPRCTHCGQPNDTPLCSSCFMAGHRASMCQECNETSGTQTRRD